MKMMIMIGPPKLGPPPGSRKEPEMSSKPPEAPESKPPVYDDGADRVVEEAKFDPSQLCYMASDQRCGACKFFRGDGVECQMSTFPVEKEGSCMLWTMDLEGERESGEKEEMGEKEDAEPSVPVVA